MSMKLFWTCLLCAASLVSAPIAQQSAVAAQGMTTGSVTGLPTPRYVSLKSDRVNLREGPSKDHRTTWVFQRAGLPVEITGEFETWRRIRDSEGSEGWVLHSLLSGRRTALVSPWMKGGTLQLFETSDEKSPVVAQLQPGVLGNVRSCNGRWCRIYGQGFDGWIAQDKLWGVYPQEKLD
ncbi:SH3 domain-containing protein [Terrarubrum flagellatum]|uniref:SH3 domain-containing protein n=1 Tax=Terrirubrum flagellatum TaxID=2895980 RepID=UPI003144E198